MNGRTIILLILAIVIAIVTAVIIKNRSQTTAVQNSTKILIASADIEAGSFVHADKQLVWGDWPQGQISPAFITSDAHKVEEYNGGMARRTILAGEPITTLSIVRANEGGFLSTVLTPGKRASSIAVNPTSGNAGFIFPGDRVDLILTHRIAGGTSGDVLASETFIQDVRVLAIDQMLENPENKAVVAKTITLEVTPRQAEMINVASNLGQISVSLRSLANDIKSAPKVVLDPKSSMDTKVTEQAEKNTPTELPAKDTVSPEPAIISQPIISNDAGITKTYSTDSDVSNLMGKSEVHSKVNVYHGNTSEQIDFHQGQK